jgi:hypothetical protein
VLVGWVTGGAKGSAAQSLGRDLSLSPGYELLQQFVPELKTLRQPEPAPVTLSLKQGGAGEKCITIGSAERGNTPTVRES